MVVLCVKIEIVVDSGCIGIVYIYIFKCILKNGISIEVRKLIINV